MSLSVNYLPSKFSPGVLSPSGGARKRRKREREGSGGPGPADPMLPKFGGGVDAFRKGVARMGRRGEDEDEDDQDDQDGNSMRMGKRTQKKPRWNKFKWILSIANACLTIYSLIGLIACLLTWFNIWTQADIIRVGNKAELVISTLASLLGIVTAVIGWGGILLNNRAFLAIYTFLLWVVFCLLVAPGYIAYHKIAFNLEGKLNSQWSRELGADGRLRIQNQLKCCGYFSPFIEATVSQTCYARSLLPGCKLRYFRFEKMALKKWYMISFYVVPVHLLVMIAGLLCSNHVTYRFGKGMMPKRYRLSLNSMAVIMDAYASQLAEQYGSDVAEDAISRSKENLQLASTQSTDKSRPTTSRSTTSR
ncbi:hypothetical protein BDN72DRAFT_773836 [Pluteus cervinus]|uniref:Uncharacterized protein n=1 Tax=Pluteus cervinus TaxID=181527 RepID=A0ACD3AHK2_9AGAR|nr:hypothetical protein BDN72DRAFT_773836 [Pluteus cervinus]